MLPNAFAPDMKDSPVLRRLAECKRIVSLTSTIGAGLLAEVAVFTALGTDAPQAARFAFFFVITFFVAALGVVWTRGSSEFQVNAIESLLERQVIHKTMPMDEVKKLSKNTITAEVSRETRFFYVLAIIFTFLSAVLLIAQAWFSFLASPGQSVADDKKMPVAPLSSAPPPTSTIDPSLIREAPRFNLTLFFAQALAKIGITTDEAQTKVAGELANDFFEAFAAKAGKGFANKIFETGSSEQPVQHTVATVLPYTRLFLFNHDSAQISEGGNRSLSELIDFFRRGNNCRVEIRSAADGTGSEKYNLWLSWRRANAVATALIAGGVDPWRIQVIARGSSEAHPGADQHQRRAEAKVSCEPMTLPSQ